MLHIYFWSFSSWIRHQEEVFEYLSISLADLKWLVLTVLDSLLPAFTSAAGTSQTGVRGRNFKGGGEMGQWVKALTEPSWSTITKPNTDT